MNEILNAILDDVSERDDVLAYSLSHGGLMLERDGKQVATLIPDGKLVNCYKPGKSVETYRTESEAFDGLGL